MYDRLGSVRIVFDWNGDVVNQFNYDVYGEPTQELFVENGSLYSSCYNSYHRFANYKWDAAIGMYDCNARWYDPVMMRFTGRDPVRGDFNEPLSLHRYLYCLNDSVNGFDPAGLTALQIAGATVGAADIYATGLTIATIGASIGNDVVLGLGAIIMQTAPLALARGLTNPVDTLHDSLKDLPRQIHHFATNKHLYWTPRMNKIVKKYGLSLNGNWNKMELLHRGRHPGNYHSWVFENMKMIDKIACGDADMFIGLFNELVIDPVVSNPMLLRKAGWL